MIVHKFGGSSLSTAEKIKNVANIITDKDQGVVVSASAKTTSKLQNAIELAIKALDYTAVLYEILDHHNLLIEELMPNNNDLKQKILQDIRNIKHILSTIVITNFCADSLKFFILCYGEIWSANILSDYLNIIGKKSIFVDASQCLIVNDSKYPVTVNWAMSLENIQQFQKENYIF